MRMDAQFSINIDAARDLVRITVSGFFTDDAVDRFIEERGRKFLGLRCGRNRHLSLTDIRGMKIQAQPIVERFRDVLSDPAYRSRRHAFVVGSTLTRMQVMRAAENRDAAYFTDPAKAELWLFSEAVSRAA